MSDSACRDRHPSNPVGEGDNFEQLWTKRVDVDLTRQRLPEGDEHTYLPNAAHAVRIERFLEKPAGGRGSTPGIEDTAG